MVDVSQENLEARGRRQPGERGRERGGIGPARERHEPALARGRSLSFEGPLERAEEGGEVGRRSRKGW